MRHAHLLLVAGVLSSAGCAAAGPGASTSPTPLPASRDARPGTFYRGLDYGSEAQFNPLTQILNEGFDMLRVEGSERHIHRELDDYRRGLGNVVRSVLRPDRVYERYGWGRALRNEILPLTFTRKDGGGSWGPNYTFHLLGSGMVSARMVEWFEAHGSSHPVAMSFLTMTVSHVLNESVENTSEFERYTADAATDLLLFDPAGFLLFRVPAVRRFFSRTLEFTNWPGQPTWVLPDHTLENTGQQFVLRGPLPWTDRWRFFHGFGIEMLFGVTRDLRDGYALSVAAGGKTVDVRIVDERTGTKTVDLRPVGGIFLDRYGSLLASIRHMEGQKVDAYGSDAWLALNVYPGVVRVPGLGAPGMWLHVVRSGGVRIGVTPAFGVGAGFFR